MEMMVYITTNYLLPTLVQLLSAIIILHALFDAKTCLFDLIYILFYPKFQIIITLTLECVMATWCTNLLIMVFFETPKLDHSNNCVNANFARFDEKLQTNNVQTILIKVSFDKYLRLLHIITRLIHGVHTSRFNTKIQKMKQANFWQSIFMND